MTKGEEYRYRCTECYHVEYGEDLELCEECLHVLRRLNRVNPNEDPSVSHPRVISRPGRICVDKSDLEALAKKGPRSC